MPGHVSAAGPAARLTLGDLRRALGPGLLWAGSAIGVSHLVQSTRAGATAGLALLGVILAALALKYPFFEFGPRFAAATRTSLIEGYAGIGRWALWLFFALTVISGVVVNAAILLLTAFLVRVAIGSTVPVGLVAAGLYAACGVLLAVGRYRLLDLSIKVILALLAASTLVAAGFAAPRVELATLAPTSVIGARGLVSFGFVLALAGWMPTAIDLSVWSSLWTLAKDRSSGTVTSVAAARADFLIGYVGTGVLAFAFVVLGAAVMYGTGTAFSEQGGGFSVQLIDLYAETLGGWARPFVLVAVLTTMLSTSLTVVDGFPRALERTLVVLRRGTRQSVAPESRRDATARGHYMEGRGVGDADPTPEGGPLYWGWLIALGASTAVVDTLFVGSLTSMADFATTMSFLTAPVLGYLNLRAIQSPAMPAEHRPGRGLVLLAWTGIVVMAAFGVVYVAWLAG